MIKEIKKEKTIVETIKEYYCDDCGERIATKYIYSSNCCEICGKVLCNKCICHSECLGDYTNIWCVNCWETIGSRYRQQIEDLEKEIKHYYTEWEMKCKESKNEKEN